jgi:Tfp pilus assembly pilus retraction ATPase PilT
MQTMSQALVNLVQQHAITPETAISHATEPDEVRQMLGHNRPRALSR